MAGAFGFDMEDQPLPPTRCIQIFETNYNFEKQLAVQGLMTVGELAVAMVKEIGKSNHVFDDIFNGFEGFLVPKLATNPEFQT